MVVPALMLLLVFLAGCANRTGPSPVLNKSEKGLRPQKFIDENTTFTTGPLPAGWRRLWGYDGDLAFYNDTLKATIMVNATCNIRRQMPLVALRNHLLIDIAERFVVDQKEVDLDMRRALHTTVQGRLDGSLIKMELYVVKIDSCVYDFAYIVNLESYEIGKEAFTQFVNQFHARRKG
jgi:hypothetical protein